MERLAPDREGPLAGPGRGRLRAADRRRSAPSTPRCCSPTPRSSTSRIQELTFTIDQIANGSRGLLEEVATGKVTGEEEYWSRTDLWDFQANVDGARVGFEGVEPILETKDPELAEELTARFAALQVLLDAQRQGEGFTLYDDLSPTRSRTWPMPSTRSPSRSRS